MVAKQMVELHVDVAEACQRVGGLAMERVMGLGITITTLAQEHQQDPEALAKLYSLARAVHDSPQWTQEEYLRRFDRWEAVFIARTALTYVGYTYLTEQKDTPEMLYQCMTGVRPEYRRRGVGTTLKVRGIRYAYERGFRAIITRVRASNQASLAMNQKLGFREQAIPTTA